MPRPSFRNSGTPTLACKHFGRVVVDADKHRLTFKIEGASLPNWEGKEQLREYSYVDDTLTYAVLASASGNGTIAYSIWQRVHP